jgi:streptogramin lyase
MRPFARRFAGLVLLGSMASAETLYVTAYENKQILRLDTATHATVVVNTSSAPGHIDSLIFDRNGRILYSTDDGGQVRVFDPAAHTDTLLANLGGVVADLLLDPSGTTVLASQEDTGSLVRITLSNGSFATLGSAGAFPLASGTAYDPNGNLYVASQTHIVRIHPVTGAIQLTGPTSGVRLDGLTYDPSSQRLWAADLFGNCIRSFDLGTLTGSACVSVNAPDGIVADGVGNLYVAAFEIVYRYNIAANTLTAVSDPISGLDDIAPLLATPSSVPAVSATALLILAVGLLLAGLAMLRSPWRQHGIIP